MTRITGIGSVLTPPPPLSEAARGLEAVFLRQMIGAMRSASGGAATSDAEKQFRDMFDSRLADAMAAQGRGVGLGALIDRQIATATPAVPPTAVNGSPP